MIGNINPDQIGHLMGQASLPSADPAASRPTDDGDAALQVRFGDLIHQARQSAQADTEAMCEARELLQSGQLTSLEHIESAARNMLSFGI